MAKQKANPLEKIQKGESCKIARLFFRDYTILSVVSKIKYNIPYITPNSALRPFVRNCFKEWQNRGYIITSKNKLPFLCQRKNKTYTFKQLGYLMNFEPIYQFCAEKNNPLTTQEKKFLWDLLARTEMRAAILKEYPQEDIINAVLKFYIKHCILADYFSYTDKQEIANNKLTDKERLSELAELIVSDKYLRQSIADKYGDKKKKVIENIKHPFLLSQYNQKMITNYHLVKSLDKKIMNSLGVYPFT